VVSCLACRVPMCLYCKPSGEGMSSQASGMSSQASGMSSRAHPSMSSRAHPSMWCSGYWGHFHDRCHSHNS
jgi:hypothetical protein